MLVCSYARMLVCSYARMLVCSYARMLVCSYARMLARSYSEVCSYACDTLTPAKRCSFARCLLLALFTGSGAGKPRSYVTGCCYKQIGSDHSSFVIRHSRSHALMLSCSHALMMSHRFIGFTEYSGNDCLINNIFFETARLRQRSNAPSSVSCRFDDLVSMPQRSYVHHSYNMQA
jgi:hypothetical protein